MSSGPRVASWQPGADYSACLVSNRAQSHGSSDNRPVADEMFDPTNKWLELNQEVDRRLFARLADELKRIEPTIDPYADPDLQEQWTLCIRNIMRSNNSLASADDSDHDNHLYENRDDRTGQTKAVEATCPIIFDGWRCWPETKAGKIAYTSCPSNQQGFSSDGKAHKVCTENGTWFKRPDTNRYWSNYTTCVDYKDLEFRKKILNLYVIGNLTSLMALLASLIIFISFKNLNCTRVTIHKNLFLSFITNNLMWIIWYTYVVNDATLLKSNPIECQLWHILLHYFLVSNYFWMFCEGLYLHTLLVIAFVSDDKILKWFYLLGWLTPLPITVAYAYNRSYDGYYTNYCWMEESPYNWILMTPIGISLLLNLIFLINIVRVLVTKLRANNAQDTHQTRKAVRATLILIPLLGLHYILTPFRPEPKSEWEAIYEVITAICTSFQGLCVAMLFCFCNGEVQAVLRKKIKDTFNMGHSVGSNNYDRNATTRRRQTLAGSGIGGSANGENCYKTYNDNDQGADGTVNYNPQNRNRSLGNPMISTGKFNSNNTSNNNNKSNDKSTDYRASSFGECLPMAAAKTSLNGRNGSNSSSVMTTITNNSPVQLTQSSFLAARAEVLLPVVATPNTISLTTTREPPNEADKLEQSGGYDSIAFKPSGNRQISSCAGASTEVPNHQSKDPTVASLVLKTYPLAAHEVSSDEKVYLLADQTLDGDENTTGNVQTYHDDKNVSKVSLGASGSGGNKQNNNDSSVIDLCASATIITTTSFSTSIS